MLTDLPFDKCQKISRPKRASGYPTWAKPMFNELKGKLVHILYNGNYHWVVISNINCSKNKIDYQDRLFHDEIRDHVKMQICNIFKCNAKEFTFNVKICQ